MKRMNDVAVSPVVGVMLMLVVTIIIAAVVSAFAGGLASDESTTPQAALTVTAKIDGIEDTNTTSSNWQSDYSVNFEADNGLVFEHKGGDAFGLNDIYVQVQTQDAMITIGLDDTLATTNCLSSDITAYLMEIGDTDGFIMPGDRFALYADNCRIDSYGTQISWRPDNGAGGFGIYLNTKCEYKVIDKASGRTISAGSVVMK